MKRLLVLILGLVIFSAVGVWFFGQSSNSSEASSKTIFGNWVEKRTQEKATLTMIDARRTLRGEDDKTDPFGDDDVIRVLFIGMDNRVGQTAGHCDAIQLIEINREIETVSITALPRGTYAPLPAGGNYLDTDYYVSNSCGLVSLEYGVEQIERILGKKTDYLVVVGFSQAMGLFRQLNLPTTETLQWLRHRQGYAIGEPQRARNHSNFIKQLLVKYSDDLNSKIATPIQYIMYKFLKTDLSFKQTQMIADAIGEMSLAENAHRISLHMKPHYDVRDYEYDPNNLQAELDRLVKPIAHRIPEGAYTGETESDAEQRLLAKVKNEIGDTEFVEWAYNTDLWLQIDNDYRREALHYALLIEYLKLDGNEIERQKIVSDYIMEMQDIGLNHWIERGVDLLVPEAESDTIGIET